MSEIKMQDNQNELFSEFSSAPKKTERLSSIPKASRPILISTNIEQLLIASILLVLFLCFIFFMGVLRGKGLAQPAALTRVAIAPKTGASASTKQPERVFSPPSTPALQSSAAFEPAVPVTAGLDLSKPYTIQLVTHKKKDYAEKEVAALKATGRYSWIIPSGDYYQVCAGQYLNKDAAKSDLRFFASKYKDCFLRRR
jgi:cell division septation protein DedD